MPGIPLVVVADARSDLGCERICTDHAPLVVVREPGGKIKFDRVMPALYAAVKGSIEP
ncbi:hypothetical protein D3C83_231590 [compost metagenome]